MYRFFVVLIMYAIILNVFFTLDMPLFTRILVRCEKSTQIRHRENSENEVRDVKTNNDFSEINSSYINISQNKMNLKSQHYRKRDLEKENVTIATKNITKLREAEKRKRIDISCFDDDSSNFTYHIENRKRRIYFLETSCSGGLAPQQACSVESAARAHPDWIIVVFLTGSESNDPMYTKARSELESFTNVEIVKMNVKEFVKKTPLEIIFKNGLIKDSLFPIAHASDLLRILILNKYSGIYLDLDMIVKKPLNKLPKNFVVENDQNFLVNSIISLSNSSIGKNFSNIALQDVSRKFNTAEYETNGPDILNMTLQKICENIPKTLTMNYRESKRSCRGLHVLHYKYFFPIKKESWMLYYEEPHEPYTEAYTHHLWNHMANDGLKPIPEASLFSELALKYCPTMYKSFLNVFSN